VLIKVTSFLFTFGMMVFASLASAEDYFFPTGNQSFEGKISDIISDQHIVVVRYDIDKDNDYEDVNCYVSRNTQIIEKGEKITMDDLREGKMVHIDISADQDGHHTTNNIIVLDKK